MSIKRWYIGLRILLPLDICKYSTLRLVLTFLSGHLFAVLYMLLCQAYIYTNVLNYFSFFKLYLPFF